MPVLAVMTAASSGAHLTKYSNITDPVKGQKKLIVDEAITPPRAVLITRQPLLSPPLLLRTALLTDAPIAWRSILELRAMRRPRPRGR